LYFIIQHECNGKLVTEELIDEGENKQVTKDNLNDYIKARFFIKIT